MKNLFLNLHSRFLSILIFLALLINTHAYAQRPQDTPDPGKSEPISLDSLPQILIYIGLPVFFVLLYIWLRRRKRKS
jgi:uncharacterized BrkB/YihY/UPF0761 family membrane protein